MLPSRRRFPGNGVLAIPKACTRNSSVSLPGVCWRLTMSLLLTLLSEGLIDDMQDDKSLSLSLSIRWTQGRRYKSVAITLFGHGNKWKLLTRMKSLRKARGCLLLVRGTNDCPTYQHFGCMVRTIHAGLLICTHLCSSATRIAHQLLDGPIPMEIRVHLTDGSFSS